MFRKSLAAAALTASIFLFFSCGGSPQSVSETSDKDEETFSYSVPLDEGKFVKKYGRCYMDEDATFCEIANTAAGFEVCFRGTQLYADMRGSYAAEGIAYISVFVDGELYDTIGLDLTQQETLLFESEDNESHTVKVLKRSEAQYSTVTVFEIYGDGTFYPVERTDKMKIAFYGDSITCGMGNLPEQFTTTAQEDGLTTYATIAAEQMNAEVDICACSGWAIDKADWHTSDMRIPRIFRQYSPFREDIYLQIDSETDYVVVNLGTNDYTYYQNHQNEFQTFIDKYYTFYEDLRKFYPSAHIVLAYGIMNWGNLVNDMEKAVTAVYERAVSENKDENISCLRLYTVTTAEEIGVNGHPSVLGHQKAAEDLYAFLSESKGTN